MKLIIAMFLMFSIQTVFAQVTDSETIPTPTPEEERQSFELRCHVIKTPWYLKKSMDHAKKIASCWLPGCQIVHARKSEKNFCKAVHSCERLDEYLNSPCTADNRLNEEAREDLKGYMQVAAKEAYEFVKKLIEDARD